MADAPWRCSQCGTVNAPSANACRACGRWPSLFDLQSGAVDVEVDEQTSGAAPDSAGEQTWRYDEPSAPPPPRYAEEPGSADEPWSADEPRAPDQTARPASPAQRADADDVSTAAGGPRRSGTEWRGPEPSIPPLPAGTWVRRLTRLLVPIAIVVYVLISAIRR